MWLALANEDLWLELLKPHSQQTEIHVAGCARDIYGLLSYFIFTAKIVVIFVPRI